LIGAAHDVDGFVGLIPCCTHVLAGWEKKTRVWLIVDNIFLMGAEHGVVHRVHESDGVGHEEDNCHVGIVAVKFLDRCPWSRGAGAAAVSGFRAG
jgi:hypothetical protein